MPWTNSPQRVYHGTDEVSAWGIQHGYIDLAKSRLAADFGPGFYVTSSRHQAQEWANQRSLRTGNAAAVLAFDLDRDQAASMQDHLAFVMFGSDFFEFVAHNRGSKLPVHGRASGVCYDIVYGPVAAYPQRLVYHDCDQICLATTRAVSALSGVVEVVVASPGPRFP